MLEVAVEKIGKPGRDTAFAPVSRMPDVSSAADIARHFRENYPILLDGALPGEPDRGYFIRHARETLARGKVDPALLPAAILREVLDTVSLSAPAEPGKTSVKAGLTAIGPRRARIWWDQFLLDDFADILADLRKPRLVLRFYDITGLDPDSGRWHEVTDLDVLFDEKGRTLDFWTPDRAYIVDLGLIHADNRFLRLARTNTVHLPREGKSETAAKLETARSNLRRRRRVDSALVPDAEARMWAESRADYAGRDVDAEMMVYMLYRAFRLEGPRALRRSPGLYRRDGGVLRREYAERCGNREKKSFVRKKKLSPPSVLVMRLGASDRPEVARTAFFAPAPLSGLTRLAGESVVDGMLPLYLGAVAWAVGGHVPGAEPILANARSLAARIIEPGPGMAPARPGNLVRTLPAGMDVDAALLASPVFEAAQSLRQRLDRMEKRSSDLSEALENAASDPLPAKCEPVAVRTFGGAEARRLAKAGVRVTRMSLTLEGRMRPGARLKVAGKLVHADKDGCFRLECVLSGRKTSIPMRAGASIGGEARSLINIDWEKRADKKKCFD